MPQGYNTLSPSAEFGHQPEATFSGLDRIPTQDAAERYFAEPETPEMFTVQTDLQVAAETQLAQNFARPSHDAFVIPGDEEQQTYIDAIGDEPSVNLPEQRHGSLQEALQDAQRAGPAVIAIRNMYITR